MDRTRDKNLIIEPNAAMPGRKYSEEKPLCYQQEFNFTKR